MTTRTRVRRARVPHVACGGHCPQIQPGDLYIEHTWFPGGDSEYANSAARPVRMTECRKCAERYGRGHLLAARDRPGSEPRCSGVCPKCGAPCVEVGWPFHDHRCRRGHTDGGPVRL